jgi:hypothetical protein
MVTGVPTVGAVGVTITFTVGVVTVTLTTWLTVA